MQHNIPIRRFGGMNTRSDREQIDPEHSISARNVSFGRHLLESRRGYAKATARPRWGRSTEIRGLRTGILASKLPANLSMFWDDEVSTGVTKIALQVRVAALDLSSVTDAEVPYSLDYNGGHKRPAEVSQLITGSALGGPCSDYTIYKRITEAMGVESDDSLLWKPTGSNRYDATAGKMYPWLPGNTASVSVADAANRRPRIGCVFGTGPLREFPLWHTNNSQSVWSSVVGTDWLKSYRTNASEAGSLLRFPAPWAQAANVTTGHCDAGDLYVFYVWSPHTQSWHLMFLWEYSNPGAAVGSFHANGMNRLFVFAGWGLSADNKVAAAIDPTKPHTITVALTRSFGPGAPSRMEIGVDGDPDLYGETLSVPLPGGGGSGTAASAPKFGLEELSGLVNVSGKDNRTAWRGRTLYLGGLPKMTNQRGAYGYGCGHSANRGGTIGVTCPLPGAYSEFRLFAGDFRLTGASDATSTPDDGGTLAAMSGLAPHSSRAVKMHAGGVQWGHSADPTSSPYTGCVNIWRLSEVEGDVFLPAYKLSGSTPTTGFKTSGTPIPELSGYAQDFHPFEPISNGALIAPSGMGLCSGALRFNGGTPAFTLAAAKLLADRGMAGALVSGDPTTTFGKMKPPREMEFLVIYEPVTAPETEPASVTGADGSDSASEFVEPSSTAPSPGEVQTLLQIMSPNREGKTTTTWSSALFGTDPLGHTQGATQRFDHPDSVWSDSGPPGGASCGTKVFPPGRRDLEMARLDLVAHRVSTVAGTPTEAQLERRFVVRSDFGHGATPGDYALSPTSQIDAGLASQQRGNSKFFRRSASKAPGSIAASVPYDEDDDYSWINSDPAASGSASNLYPYVTLCSKAGVPWTKPGDIEGRRYAILFGYRISSASGSSDLLVGEQTLRVWDITDESDIFECVPAGAAAARSAAVGMSWTAAMLFGESKYAVCLGGKLTPQAGEWWMGSNVYPSPLSPDAYPYGVSSIGSSADSRSDVHAVAGATGMVTNGAKGLVHGAFFFKGTAGPELAVSFVSELLAESEPWHGLVPRRARDLVNDLLAHAWLADTDQGSFIPDDIGGLHMSQEESIPLSLTTGKVQSALAVTVVTGVPATSVALNRNVPYTYNDSVAPSMFEDRLRPVKVANTGRRDSLFGDDEFTPALLATISGMHQEIASTGPSREPLLAVFGHTGRFGRNQVMVVSPTALFEYDPRGQGSLVRRASLAQHFTRNWPVSRDNASGRTVLLSPSAMIVTVNPDGSIDSEPLLERPRYAVPPIMARKHAGQELSDATEDVHPLNIQLWPVAHKLAFETTIPRSPALLGIDRLDAAKGLVWTGEMPSIGPSAPWTNPYPKGIGSEQVQWVFTFTYWSATHQLESIPGNPLVWANYAPLRTPSYGVVTPSANPDNPYTGEPKPEGQVLVMRGSNPFDFSLDGAKGEPKAYNLRLRNFPLPSDPRVTHIRVYRTTANGGVPFLEQEIPIAAGPTAKGDKVDLLVGTKADSELVRPFEGGIATRVPPGARFMATYQGRTYYSGFPWAPTRVYASYQGRPREVPFFYYKDLGGSDSGPVTGLFTDNNRLFAFKEGAVYVGVSREWDAFDINQAVRGLPFDFELTQHEAGSVADRAAVSVPGIGIIFAGDQSVYAMSGMNLMRVSMPIDGESPEDLDTSRASDATDESRIVYPYALDTASREKWRAVYYEPLRCVLFSGGPAAMGGVVLALFTESMDWSFWTDVAFDDFDVVKRYGSEGTELWAVRNSRLWRMDATHADGLDYLCPDLAGEALVSGSTRLTEGTITAVGGAFVANDDYTLSLSVASLPAAYAALLGTSATHETAAADLLRDSFITVIDGVTGVPRFRRRIRMAYGAAGVVHVVLPEDELPASPPTVGDTFRLGTIDAHWASSIVKPAAGSNLVELLDMGLQRAPSGVTLKGNVFRGDTLVYFNYGQSWPTTLHTTIPGTGKGNATVERFRGRSIGYSYMLVKLGAYAPVGFTRAHHRVSVVGGIGLSGG